jgi:hypothetical protein
MTLIEVIYVSTATDKLFDWELRRILESSVRNNEDVQLTGMLLYSRDSFMQVIEGEKDAVDSVMARIAKDPRHCNLQVLARAEIRSRGFNQWSMGFHGINAADAVTWPGFAPFFQNGFDAEALSAKPGIALEILKAFAKGEITVDPS